MRTRNSVDAGAEPDDVHAGAGQGDARETDAGMNSDAMAEKAFRGDGAGIPGAGRDGETWGGSPSGEPPEDSLDQLEADPLAETIDSTHLWPGDAGTLPQDARAALLRLVKGPYIGETSDAALWRALLNHTEPIRSRLADLFLDLCIDAEAGVAFARNVSVEGRDFPKAATSYTMTLLDSIMVLLLRKELQTAGTARAFIGKVDLYNQMMQYRAIERVDPAAYQKKLDASWTRLADRHRLLMKSDVEGRYEISPVLKLVFGAEEAAAVLEEYQHLRDEAATGAPAGKAAGRASGAKPGSERAANAPAQGADAPESALASAARGASEDSGASSSTRMPKGASKTKGPKAKGPKAAKGGFAPQEEGTLFDGLF